MQANFSQVQSHYLITVSGNTNHGAFSGEGSYSHGSITTLTAYPNAGYAFSHWVETWDGYEGSFIVSTDETYTFTADSARYLKAVFRPKVSPGVMMLLLGE
jgi:hypothetical protein